FRGISGCGESSVPDKHQLFERGRGRKLHRHTADKRPQRCHPERSEGSAARLHSQQITLLGVARAVRALLLLSPRQLAYWVSRARCARSYSSRFGSSPIGCRARGARAPTPLASAARLLGVARAVRALLLLSEKQALSVGLEEQERACNARDSK